MFNGSALLAPISFKYVQASSIAFVSPDNTICPSVLKFTAFTNPLLTFEIPSFTWSSVNPMIAAIFQSPFGHSSCIYLPLALTILNPSSIVIAFEFINALYSPKLNPAEISALIPSVSSNFVIANDIVNIANCVF